MVSSTFLLTSSFSVGTPIKLSPPPTAVKFRPLQVTAAGSSTCFCPPPKIGSNRNSSFYEVLGIPVGADGREIKAAYRKLARICHPDVDRRESSAVEFIKIHNAYSTLSDPDKRADYDRKQLVIPRGGGVRSTTSRSSYSSPVGSRYSGGRNNWETDQCW